MTLRCLGLALLALTTPAACEEEEVILLQAQQEKPAAASAGAEPRATLAYESLRSQPGTDSVMWQAEMEEWSTHFGNGVTTKGKIKVDGGDLCLAAVKTTFGSTSEVSEGWAEPDQNLNGENVGVWTCPTGEATDLGQFDWLLTPEGKVVLAKNPMYCLNAEGDGSAKGTNIILYSENCVEFKLLAPSGLTTFQKATTDVCLGLWGEAKDGTSVALQPCPTTSTTTAGA